jgi:polyisoprenoid-binding protein YceI
MLFCCGNLVAGNPPINAGLIQVEINPARSSVHFTLGAFLHTVYGTFNVTADGIRLDLSTGQLSGQISVDVKSGQTGNGARDRQMHETVLESNRFPEAVFTLNHLQGRLAMEGGSNVEVQGILRIHGVDHELSLPVTVTVRNNLITATAKFAVPYVAWGMKDPGNFLLRVDQTVDVEVELSGSSAK